VAARESAVLKVSKEREALLQKDHERETTIDNLVDEYTKVLHIIRIPQTSIRVLASMWLVHICMCCEHMHVLCLRRAHAVINEVHY
jgi:hypothetical protein